MSARHSVSKRVTTPTSTHNSSRVCPVSERLISAISHGLRALCRPVVSVSMKISGAVTRDIVTPRIEIGLHRVRDTN
jgi:hypothetical protein